MSDTYHLYDAKEDLENESFQYKVYASTRLEEIAAWGWGAAQQESFLRMQFSIQQRSYASQYPGARYQIIVLNGECAGHVLIVRTDRFILLADIALLHQYRNKGAGTFVITTLQEEARGLNKTIKLRVLKTSFAGRLYERLGFHTTSEHGMHVEMEWKASD